MFQLLAETAAADSKSTKPKVDIHHPPPGYIAPMGASHNTWGNIYKNMGRINYCTKQFHYISNRIKCISDLTGGPFLA